MFEFSAYAPEYLTFPLVTGKEDVLMSRLGSLAQQRDKRLGSRIVHMCRCLVKYDGKRTIARDNVTEREPQGQIRRIARSRTHMIYMAHLSAA